MAPGYKAISLNVRGIKTDKKRHNLFHWLRKKNHDIIFLQETHCHNKKQDFCWGKEWDGQAVWAWGTNNSKGVAVLFNRNIRYEYDVVVKDMNGRIIVIDIKLDDQELRLINTYAPNNPVERCSFFQKYSCEIH